MVKLIVLCFGVLLLTACAGQPSSQAASADPAEQASRPAPEPRATNVDWLSLGGRLSDEPAVSSSHYQVHEGGLITDTQSRVQWMACSLGQYWSEERRCSGANETYSYQQALTQVEEINKQGFAGYSDWRLPSERELLSLIQPEISLDTFPQSLPLHYWASDQTTKPDYYLAVSFRSGVSQAWPARSRFAVRLVRSSVPEGD